MTAVCPLVNWQGSSTAPSSRARQHCSIIKTVPKTLRELRRFAISSTLWPKTTLRIAVDTLGFVQADPIRSPARAQDLILRQRVRNYRAGDLYRNYRSLRLEEDFLYAYGFMPQSTWQLLHPRRPGELTDADQQVLSALSGRKDIHPRDLKLEFGSRKEVNAWGGFSSSSTRSLERLHYRGLIRVSKRESGIKLYEETESTHTPQTPQVRLRSLVMLVAQILSPISEKSLRSTLSHLRHAAPDLTERAGALSDLIRTEELVAEKIDGVRYLWPGGKADPVERERGVRFLAPFDPLVWDRRRFEHLWGWAYRFEAYTPPLKRKMGYYALPLLWRDDVIGWVNVLSKDGGYEVQPGFVSGSAHAEVAFRRAYEAEVESLRTFLRERSARS